MVFGELSWLSSKWCFIWVSLRPLVGGSSQKLHRRIHNQPISQGLIAFVFVTILLYGWFAESAGHMATITGAFLAGLWFGRTSLKEKINSGISTIAYGIFVPIFFINIGLSANARELTVSSLILLAVMTVVADYRKGGRRRLGSVDGGIFST